MILVCYINNVPWHFYCSIIVRRGARAEENDEETILHYVFMIFQCRFAVVTPSLIIGTCAERIRNTSAFLALG
jgi:ammonia channel protein AmtB